MPAFGLKIPLPVRDLIRQLPLLHRPDGVDIQIVAVGPRRIIHYEEMTREETQRRNKNQEERFR